MRTKGNGVFRLIVFFAAVLAVLMLFHAGVSNLSSGRAEEGRLQLEAAVRRAAVACYAAEGFYPPGLEYLQAHYGLQHDSERYTIIYEVSGANLMPDITVLKRGQ